MVLSSTRSQSSKGFSALRSRHPRLLRLFISAVLASIALFSVGATSAQALDIGLMSGDSSWQEKGSWDTMQKSGATVFRMQMNRASYVQHGWTEFNNAFEYAAERNITILPYLYGYTDPYRFPTEAEWSQPGNPWETWLYEVVHQYGYNGDFWNAHPALPYHPVGAWQVWNEPNLSKNNPLIWNWNKVKKVWESEEKPQPENYAKFLQRSSQAIRAAQAEKSSNPTQVVFGGLYSKNGMSVDEFLKKAKNVLGSGTTAFDALGLHPYSFTDGIATFQSYVTTARSNLTAYFGNKQLWITELGWNVEPWAKDDKDHLPVTVDDQAKYLTESFNWVKSVASEKNIHLIIWYLYRDNNASSAWDSHTGLRSGGSGDSGEYRPAWYAFQAQTGAPEWPYRWQSNNLGGVATSDPDMLTYGAGGLEVFERGSDGALWTRSFAGTGWNGWSSVAGSVVGGPGAVWGGGQPTVVSRIGDATANSWWWNGGSWSSYNLGGNNTSDADLSAWSTTRMDMFVRGSDYALWHRAWNNGIWGNWESLGGNLSSGPAAVSWGPNRIDVVALNNDPNRTLNHWWYDGTWHCCDNLGGVNTTDPDIASTGSGHLNVFVRGSDNALWNLRYESGAGWVGWERIGGTLASGPGAVSWGQNERLDVVAQASDHSLTHWWWGPGGG